MPLLSLTLKTRIALLTTVLAAVLGCGIVMASLYSAHRDLHEALQNQQDSIVKLSANQLDTAMEDRINLLAHQAGIVAGMLAAPLAEPPAARLARVRNTVLQGIPMPQAFNAVLVADAQGAVLGDEPRTIDIGDRGYYREVARTLSPVVYGPMRARTDGSIGVVVAVPVVHDGAFAGLIAGWLNLSLPNFLMEAMYNRVGITGFYCLVSSGHEPVYVHHPDPMQARKPAMAVGDTCGIDNRPAALEYLTPHQPVISRYLMTTTGWELVAVLPAREAYSPLRLMQWRILALALVALCVVAGLIWISVRQQLRPLSRLHAVVRDSADDLSAFERLRERVHDDEIGDLTRAFVHLMHELRERQQLLDRSERRLRAVTDTLPSMLAFVDTEERYVFNNIAYERVCGMTVGQLRGKPLREVLGEERYAIAQPCLRRALAGEAVTFESEVHTPEYHCMEVNFRPEWSADAKQVVGVHIHVQDVTASKLETQRLARISRTDHLTQLLNRSAFEAKLQEAMARSRVHDRLMALLFLDMDRFKAVNDVHGHAIGDQLLQAFAGRLRRCVREGDAVARLGGDEFAIVLEDIGDPAVARRIAADILQAVGQPFHIEGILADVDVSIGIALYRGGPMQEQELARLADVLLYRAKAAGRGRYEIGPEGMAEV